MKKLNIFLSLKSFIFRIRLLSAFISLIFFFFVFTLITYHYISDNNGDRSDGQGFNSLEKWSNRIPRVHSYCNPFTSIGLNEELYNISALIPDMVLSRVMVMIRHGDRSPLRTVKHLSSISCDPLLSLKSYDFKNLFKRFFGEAKDILRTRLSVSHNYAVVPNSGCRVGHLSRFGCAQHLTLGSLLGQYYRNGLNISNNNIKVLTTSYPRTFQSAVAFLYGFLKPVSVIDFQHFPQIETTFGTFFCSSSEFCLKKCTKLDNLNKILNENKRKLLSSQPDVIKLLDNLKSIIAKNPKEFDSPVAIFDGLMAYMCHSSVLPCNDKRCVTVEDVKQLMSYIELHGKQLADSEAFKHSSWLKIFGFLSNLIKQMNDLENRQKFILYSGHDITIVALTTALGFFDGNIPPYASRVIFETYKHKSNIYLRIIFNGKDMTRFTEICSSNLSKCLPFAQKQNLFLISIRDFSDFILEKFKSITKSDDYQTACL